MNEATINQNAILTFGNTLMRATHTLNYVVNFSIEQHAFDTEKGS